MSTELDVYGRDWPEPVDPGPEGNEAAHPHAALLDLVKSGDWLDAQEFPPVRWSVPGLIPEGFGLLTGAPKIGKSWLVLDFALAVASGGKALGHVATGDPRPVLYVALEDGDRRLQSRARKLLQGQPIPRRLSVVTGGVLAVEVLALIPAWLDAHRGEDPLVILDTLGKVMPPASPGEGAYQRDYRIGTVLKQIVDAHPGATLLVVHHVRKQSGDDWMDSTSGTNGLNGAADFTVNLARSRNDAAGVVRVTGRDVLENEYAVTYADGAWALDGGDLSAAAVAAEAARVVDGLADRSAEIVDLVAANPGIGPAEVGRLIRAETTGDPIGTSAATKYLTRLVDSDRIRKTGRGQYAPRLSVTCVTSGTSNSTHDSPSDSGDPGKVTQVTEVTQTSRRCGCGVPLPAGMARCGACFKALEGRSHR